MFDTIPELPLGMSTEEAIAWFNELFERRYPSVTSESAALVDRIALAARVENQAAAQRLVAIGELFGYRLSRCSDTEDWAADTTVAVAAEVSAALRISAVLAHGHLRYARAMREELPRVGAVFLAGDIDYRLFKTIVYRTDLITDPAVMATVDEQLAASIARWPTMSRGQLAGRIDRIVARVDPDAVRRRRDHLEDRHVAIWESKSGMVDIEASVAPTDGLALDQRLDALAATVCGQDPRTVAQRRADALGVLAYGADRLACRSEHPDCPAGAKPPAAGPVIHVVAPQASITGRGDTPGVLLGTHTLISPEELANSATFTPLIHPGNAAPERRYLPSRALADFVRCRDLTCRWPGCDTPATACDLDHTIPYAQGGPTHASNLKCYCRSHHLVKTFWGWQDKQLPDGTLILTSPTGHTYVTLPGSAQCFPTLCRPTGELSLPPPPTPTTNQRTAKMPRRRRTRDQDRAARINTERHHNQRTRRQRRRAAISPGPPTTNATNTSNDEPPPF